MSGGHREHRVGAAAVAAMSALHIPTLEPGCSTLTAALAYAAAGWYVGPLRAGTKHPGSVLDERWQEKTSREPEVIAAWFAGTDHGVFLHVGRSGAIVLDVDQPERLHPDIAKAVADTQPLFQSTRDDQPGRGHYLFAQPPGRDLGNSLGTLASGWGEIRGRNGVIVAAPSAHRDGGRYQWQRTGAVPVLPACLAERLDDALDAAQAATDAQVTTFLAEHRSGTRPELLGVHVEAFDNAVRAGESRHDTMPGHLAGAMKEAAAGLIDATLAAHTLESTFLVAVAKAPQSSKQRPARTGAKARSEWSGLLAWAVAQGRAADVDATRTRSAEKVPALTVLDGGDDSGAGAKPATGRRVRVIWADTIQPEPVIWAWKIDGQGRLPAGALSLFAGREGTGKSSAGVWLTARITTGTLPGSLYGTPRRVLYVAIEDSWKHTIVPRLIAAGADLGMVGRMDVTTTGDNELTLSLPDDNAQLERAIVEHHAAAVMLDPLMSLIGANLDTNQTRQVREALDPLAGLADRTGAVVLGVAHFNKSRGTDVASLITASGAFKDVPRALFAFARDDDGRVMTQVKNSLGRDDLPSQSYEIASTVVPVQGGSTEVGAFKFTGESERTVHDIVRDARGDDDQRSERDEAVEWLVRWLTDRGGEAPALDVFKAGRSELMIGERTLQRAKEKAKIKSVRAEFRGPWVWRLPVPVVSSLPQHDSQGDTNPLLTENLSPWESREKTDTPPPCEIPVIDAQGDRYKKLGALGVTLGGNGHFDGLQGTCTVQPNTTDTTDNTDSPPPCAHPPEFHYDGDCGACALDRRDAARKRATS